MRHAACPFGDFLWRPDARRQGRSANRGADVTRAARGGQRSHLRLAQHAAGPRHRRWTAPVHRRLEPQCGERRVARVTRRIAAKHRDANPGAGRTGVRLARIGALGHRRRSTGPGKYRSVSRAYNVAAIPAASHCRWCAGERPGADCDRAGGKCRQAAPRGEVAPAKRRAVSPVVERRTSHDVDRRA